MNKHLQQLEAEIYKVKIETKSGGKYSLCGFEPTTRIILAKDSKLQIFAIFPHDVNRVIVSETKERKAK